MYEQYWFLKNCPVFAGLTSEPIQQLESQCRIRSFERHAPIQAPGPDRSGIILVLEGEVRISLQGVHGQSNSLALLEPGDVVGELPEPAGAGADEQLLANRASILAYIPATALLRLIAASPHSHVGITKRIGLTRFRLAPPIQQLVFRSTRERLNHLFRDLKAKLGYQLPDYATALGVRLSQDELARVVLSTPVAVRLALDTLRKSRQVRYAGDRIVLTSDQAA